MIENVNLFIAFVAGFISFFSPCVVVIIPIFLSNLAGVPFDQKDNSVLKKHILYSTLVFTAGFILVFTLFGILSGFFAQFLAQNIQYFNIIAGILIIIFGLVTLEIIPLPILQRTFKVNVRGPSGYNLTKSFLVGAAFAAGWTPCVGPILAAILVLAGSSATATTGGFYLIAYGFGLALPFLFFALFINRISNWLQKITPLLRYFNIIAGSFLLALGILLISGKLSQVVSFFYLLTPPQL